MSDMHQLIVIGFHGKERASEVLKQLPALSYDGTIDLFDAVAAHRSDDGMLQVDDSIQPTTTVGLGFAAGAAVTGVADHSPMR
jgi:uncharacterized membrane protein